MASQATRSSVAHGPLGGFGLGMVAPIDQLTLRGVCLAARRCLASGPAATRHEL
jgi:hypothetical protein